MDDSGIVFNVQRFTIHDGPGIRTEFFMKGCPLRCRWCSNPEGLYPYQQVGVYSSKCIGVSKCGMCMRSCPHAAEGTLLVEDDIVVGINRDVCDNCLKCAAECPSDALKLWGRRMSVDEAMKIILADKNFYERSGGGVTISGGEALLQWPFVKSVFQKCRENGVQTCVETALHVPREVLDEIIPVTDLVITDIKQIDPEIHKAHTGVDNQRILGNVSYLAQKGVRIVLRIPVIPGFNDSWEEIEKIGRFIHENLKDAVLQVQLLRFRRLGEEKYQSLGMPYLVDHIEVERTEFEQYIKDLAERLKAMGLPAESGSTAHKNETRLDRSE